MATGQCLGLTKGLHLSKHVLKIPLRNKTSVTQESYNIGAGRGFVKSFGSTGSFYGGGSPGRERRPNVSGLAGAGKTPEPCLSTSRQRHNDPGWLPSTQHTSWAPLHLPGWRTALGNVKPVPWEGQDEKVTLLPPK